MRVVDLEYGMVVENRKGTFYLVRRDLEGRFVVTGKTKWDELSNYKDNLKHVAFPQLDIIRVYESVGKTFDTIFDKCNLKLIWEREREIDWSKVPKWTKVQVRDFEGEEWKNSYFIGSSTNGVFKATYFDEFTFSEGDEYEWYQCKIYPSVETKEEWYK